MNKVYQHGEELFVTFDATPRMRNLRTGLTITPRVPFKYTGEMPQVGQVWEAKGNGRIKHILGVEDDRVRLRIPEGLEGTVPVAIFIKNHVRKQETPGLSIAQLIKDGYLGEMPQVGQVWEAKRNGRVKHILGVEGARVRLRIPEGLEGTVPVAVFIKNHTLRPEPNYLFAPGTPEPLISKADVEASDSLVICRNDNCYLVYKKGPTKCPYCCGKSLPLPGQLWAKGSRYVTVDRVEDGRVYYTDGSSGLRRFLNEYAHINPQLANYLNVGGTGYEDIKPAQFGTPDVVDAAKMFVPGFNPPEFGTAFMFPPRPFLRPLCKPCHDRRKVEELALGYKFGKQGLKDFGAQVQQFGRMLRPSPTTDSVPCPLNTSTLNRLNTGNARENWTQYRNALGAKIRYANQRIKELSK